MKVLEHYRCPRCGHRIGEIGEGNPSTSSGARFSNVTCSHCRHTEFYAAAPDEVPALLGLADPSPGPGGTAVWRSTWPDWSASLDF